MRERLSDAALTNLNALLKVHGPFILSSKAGLENLALAKSYEERTDEKQAEQAAAEELAEEFKKFPDVVSPETAGLFKHFIEQPESSVHPERSEAFKAGMSRNLIINLVAGATIGGIVCTTGIYVGTPMGAAAGIAMLPLIEGWKKSKPFLEASNLVTDGVNELSESDISAQWKRLSKIPFDRYCTFVLANEDRLRRLLGGRTKAPWLHEHLDWLKRVVEK